MNVRVHDSHSRKVHEVSSVRVSLSGLFHARRSAFMKSDMPHPETTVPRPDEVGRGTVAGRRGGRVRGGSGG
ncbi:hypothetical protein GCM10027167_87830 [Nocardia heshunensis]